MTDGNNGARAKAGAFFGRDRFLAGYLIYLFVIALALLGVHLYVRGVMVSYEESDPAVYAVRAVRSASARDGAIGQFLEEHVFSSEYGDPQAAKAAFYEAAKSADIQAAAESGEFDPVHPVYNLTADGKPFLRVAMTETGTETKLGIMAISEWRVDSCILRDPDSLESSVPAGEDGSLSLSVSAPSDFTVLLDGAALPADSEAVLGAVRAALAEFAYVAPYVQVPEGVEYSLSGLYFEPAISALNNAGTEVSATVSAPGKWSVSAEYQPTQAAEELARSAADPLYIGKLWSKFMTDDVGGSGRGLYTVRSECRLIPGSSLYEMATRWAGSVDITFVSGHVITGWTNEKTENFIMYNEDLFSCDVYFEKNLTLKTGATRVDVFDNRMYFVRIKEPGAVQPGWYLADMLSLAGTEDR